MYRSSASGPEGRCYPAVGRSHGGYQCRHRLPLASSGPETTSGPGRRRKGSQTVPLTERTAAPCPLAQRLPLVQGPGCGSLLAWQADLLALWALAVVQLGQLATSSAAELPKVWCPLLLVPQPEKHRLQRVRIANKASLTTGAKVSKIPVELLKSAWFPAETCQE